MCSLSVNSSMLFLLLRTTLIALTACVATVYGAPVQSDTQAMVRKLTSLSVTNFTPVVGFGINVVVFQYRGSEIPSAGGAGTYPPDLNMLP
jgi:energy-converting hydrogenase Eha subunit A